MATCLIEDARLSTIYYQRANSMEQSTTSFKPIDQRRQVNFHFDSISMNALTLFKNQDFTKKRQIHRSNTYTSQNNRTRILTDNSCISQAVSTNTNENTVNRPKTLFLNERIPFLRTCLSHPATSPNDLFRINDDDDDDNDNDLFSSKFSSLPILTSPPTKRLRPQTLQFTSTEQSDPVLSTTNSFLSIRYLDSLELAMKLKSKSSMLIFDCGSPIRYSDNHICNSVLLRVSDKISRKRFKTNPTKQLPIDISQLNECHSIIFYDDHSNTNNTNLSVGIKCACEEIQRCLTTKSPSIFILKNSFEHFSNLYPNLCKSLQSSCDTSSLIVPDIITPNIDFSNCPMTHIIDGLYIGNESNAKNLDELSSENIRYIVNVTSHLPLYYFEQFHYHHIPVDDTQKQNLLKYFDDAYQFIHRAIENHEKVLVHCVAGISRSPAIVISFLMRYTQMNLNDAYEYVKMKRSIVSPNLNFMGQLLQYEKQLREQN
ncbi:hypothetical protein I4U23_007083 [Adineta vaga]|nr:hypothetical protein I4U23_007083 [Adineta vaga]